MLHFKNILYKSKLYVYPTGIFFLFLSKNMNKCIAWIFIARLINLTMHFINRQFRDHFLYMTFFFSFANAIGNFMEVIRLIFFEWMKVKPFPKLLQIKKYKWIQYSLSLYCFFMIKPIIYYLHKWQGLNGNFPLFLIPSIKVAVWLGSEIFYVTLEHRRKGEIDFGL